MAKTRSTKTTAGKKKEDADSIPKPTLKKLDASVDNPPQLFVLPKDASTEARIATISNPATSAPNRYFVCPEKGFYEFTKVAAPKNQQRSWLLAPDQENDQDHGKAEGKESGYVLQTPDMFVATPVDPLFLLLPALAEDSESGGQEYLAASDYLAKLTKASPHLSQILQQSTPVKLEQCLEARVEAVSDCMDMGDEKMYSLALPKLVKELVAKANRIKAKGLPASMEDRFVKQPLDVPVLSIKREESSISIANDGVESEPASEAQSQETDASGTTMATVSTAATSVSINAEADTNTAPDGVIDLLRTKVALDFLMSSYISPSLRTKLRPLLSNAGESGVDFSSLDKHLAHIASLKKEAQALRSLSDNISRKRSAMEDDEAVERAEAKKRKKEEEDLKKKNTSQGVKKLMKADTSGMKKLSSFFAKAPAGLK
ncbi:hypothetical protein M409DRAFT_65890 [Zasmidium cellare ATCC 36951]|uniref:Ribonuclease H2 subunit B n=1 Tax=Zasmidium cellare ATCC 36951 TaxID=1080233 RepID=A0A6A6CKU2_ZASCE|nr:uncharacterized protein M409DRAFT_65890 [Zasmidium cellare ATCC 36951]KAF2167765.1 hypothetical protein M409DRAFT_65890 [Zasmidium cellare ATCC 36951]